MSEEKKDKPQVDASRLDISEGGQSSTSGDFSEGGNTITQSDDEGQGLDFNSDGTISQTGLDKLVEADGPEEGAEVKEGDEPELSDEEKAEIVGEGDDLVGERPDLGDFDPANEESLKKYDDFYFSSEGGKLNLEAFGPELVASIAADPTKPDILPATREYLKHSLGLSDQAITTHIAGVMAAHRENEATFNEIVGGAELYAKKQEWARGQYKPEQIKKFNAALKAGGQDALDALDLLNARYAKGTAADTKDTEGKVEEAAPQRRGPPGKRPASPQRDATAKSSTPAPAKVEGFDSREAHTKAQAEALASKDKASIEKVRARLLVSDFYKNS